MNVGADTVKLAHLRDVSEWQGAIAWERYAHEQHPSLHGIYVRAGHGPGVLDRELRRNLAGARSSRTHVGCYWYLQPGVGSAVQQVDALLRVAPHVGGASLRPALDCEYGSPRGRRDWYVDAILRARARLGYFPVVYGSPSYLDELNLPAWAARCPLWLADYGVATPELPKPWTHWAAWQHASDAVDPVTGQHPVDDSYIAELRALICPTRLQRARGQV